MEKTGPELAGLLKAEGVFRKSLMYRDDQHTVAGLFFVDAPPFSEGIFFMP